MRLEYRYGQAYLADLHPGDLIPDGCGNYRAVKKEEIDKNGNLKYNLSYSTNISNISLKEVTNETTY